MKTDEELREWAEKLAVQARVKALTEVYVSAHLSTSSLTWEQRETVLSPLREMLTQARKGL